MSEKARIASTAFLGREFILHMLQKYILRRPSPGFKEFIEYYRDDRIVPLTQSERDQHAEHSKCIVCGLCDPACPVLNAVGSACFAGPVDIACSLSRDLTESGAFLDPFLSTLCGACDCACPEQVPVSEIITRLRRNTRITRPEKLPAFYRDAIANLDEGKGVFGKSAPAGATGSAPVLYWRGCRVAASENGRTRKLLDKLASEYVTVEEGCCGGLPAEMGIDYDASEALKRIRGSGASQIVTGCPTCANTLRAALPEITVKLAVELIYKADSPTSDFLEGKKTAFHDPCRMGHGPDVYEPPRDILRAMGAELVPLEREKENVSCCGAGGGLLEVDSEIAQKVARNRIDEVVAAGAEALVTSCELCARHLRSVVGEEEKLQVYDLAEIFTGENL